jgi:hypothetical protein
MNTSVDYDSLTIVRHNLLFKKKKNQDFCSAAILTCSQIVLQTNEFFFSNS